MDMSVVKPGAPGVEILGADAKAFADTDIQNLKVALAQHGVAAIRGQDLEVQDLVAFAKRFGELQPSPRDQYWHPDAPEIFVISNILVDGKPIGSRDDGEIWHTDFSYLERPTGYTILYGVKTPPVGADTLFSSMRQLYEEATPEERSKFEQQQVRYSQARVFAGRLTQKQIDDFPEVTHPMVRTHPVDGKKGLYFGSYQSATVEGMEQEASDAYMKELLARATQPEKIYAHKWQPGDLVIWDNRGLLHTAQEYDKEKYERLIWRLTVMGERPE